MQRSWQSWTPTLRRVGVLVLDFISVVLAVIAIVYFTVDLFDVLVIVAVVVAAAARVYFDMTWLLIKISKIFSFHHIIRI